MKFRTILADPPWQQPMTGKRTRGSRHGVYVPALAYPTMSLDAICALDVKVLRAWGFRYLAPIHWIKPSGLGNYVIHRSQTLLLGYSERCIFDQLRYFPNLLETGNPARHSEKPEAAYELIEKVSHAARLEIFARNRREGWEAWGNEVVSSVQIREGAA